jgi:hypothetical protein
VDDVLCRELLERLQVMEECLLDQVALLHSRAADMALHQLAGGLGDLG